jgi:hypothetical protein
MPPKKQLSDGEIEELRVWIAELEKPESTRAEAVETSPPGFHVPPGIDPTLAVDLFIQAKWSDAKVTPAGRSDDATFVRRVFLDLLGRIPTREDRDRFLGTTESSKRSALVDRLLESPEHAAHFAEIFNIVFLGREDGNQRNRNKRNAWLDYLRWVFETNRSWNKVGRDLLVARPESKPEGGASWFLYEQRDDHQQIATRVSATLLGKQVQCAQCHDHPVSPEIEQRHYWGLVSFFSRSINVKTPDGPRVAEKASGGYAEFSNLEGDSSETELVMYSGTRVDEPGGRRDQDAKDLYAVAPPDQWFAKLKDGEKLKKDIGTLPVPKFSRREAFADAATTDNPDFSRAIVNRIWAHVFGRGIVHPVDQIDSAHPPSHPELLDWLAHDFSENGHDVRRLIRALMHTRTYQLDSRLPTTEESELPPQDLLFAKALDKPLSAEALYRSMHVAAGHGSGADEGTRATFAKAFPELFAEVYSPSVQQALFWTNGSPVDRLLADEAPLIKELAKLANAESIVRESFLAILGREPDAEERARGNAFLRDGNTEFETIRQLCWALLAGAEFRINH